MFLDRKWNFDVLKTVITENDSGCSVDPHPQ